MFNKKWINKNYNQTVLQLQITFLEYEWEN